MQEKDHVGEERQHAGLRGVEIGRLDFHLHRLRIVTLLLLIVLSTLLTVEQPARAQEQSQVRLIGLDLFADPLGETLCVGDQLTISVRVWKTVEVLQPSRNYKTEQIYALGTNIQATVSDASIGVLRYGKNGRNSGDSFNHRWYGFDLWADAPVAEFVFEAKKAGQANIYFESVVNGQYGPLHATKTVPIKVEDCTYQVSVIHEGWVAIAHYQGAMEAVRLVAQPNGSYTGSGTFEWTESYTDCAVVTTPTVISTSTTITARRTKYGLNVRITYAPASHSNTYGCGGGFAAEVSDSHFGPNVVTVPIKGGELTVTANPRVGHTQGEAFSGSFLVMVERVSGK